MAIKRMNRYALGGWKKGMPKALSQQDDRVTALGQKETKSNMNRYDKKERRNPCCHGQKYAKDCLN